MNGKCIAAYVTAIATVLADKFTPEELAVLAAVFTQLGDTLATILAADENCSI